VYKMVVPKVIVVSVLLLTVAFTGCSRREASTISAESPTEPSKEAAVPLAEEVVTHRHEMPEVVQKDSTTKTPEPVFISLANEAKTVNLHVISAMDATNGGMNFNGYFRGEATYTIPVGWTVILTFVNLSPAPHSVAVVEPEMTDELNIGKPYFENAASTDHIQGSPQNKPETITFVVSEEGEFSLACGFPPHAKAGHWINFIVAGKDAVPSFKRNDKPEVFAK
jgi:plastocyanin